MFTRLHKPQLFAGFACVLLAVATLPFASPARATWLPPSQSGYWDRQNYTCTAPCNPNAVGISGTAVTPDGTTLISSEANLARVQFINTSNGSIAGTVTVGSAPQAIVVNTSGTTAYVTNANDRTISVIDISSLTVTATISGLCSVTGGPTNLAITPNDDHLIQTCSNAWSNTGTAFDIVETSTNGVVTTVTPTDPAVRIAIDPSSSFFWTSSKWGTADSATGNLVSRYSIPAGTSLGSIDTGDIGTDGITNIALNGDGTILYVLKDLGAFSAWTNLVTTPTKSWQVAFASTTTRNVGGPSPLVVDNTHDLAYFVTENCCSFWPEIMEIVDLDAGAMQPSYEVSHQWATSAVLSPDGTKLYTSGRRFSDIYTYDVALVPATTTTSTTTTTTTIAPTTTEPATTTTVEEEETSVPSSTNASQVDQELLPPTGGRSSQSALGVMLLVLVGATLIITARRRHEV